RYTSVRARVHRPVVRAWGLRSGMRVAAPGVRFGYYRGIGLWARSTWGTSSYRPVQYRLFDLLSVGGYSADYIVHDINLWGYSAYRDGIVEIWVNGVFVKQVYLTNPNQHYHVYITRNDFLRALGYVPAIRHVEVRTRGEIYLESAAVHGPQWD